MWLIVVMSLACYRITRFVVTDTLWDGWRRRLHSKVLGAYPRVWRDKIHELLTCPFCLSVWVAAGLVAAVDQYTSVPLPWLTWGAVASGSLMVWRFVEE